MTTNNSGGGANWAAVYLRHRCAGRRSMGGREMQKRKDQNDRTYWVNPPETFEMIKRMYPDTVELAEVIRKFVVMRDGTINGYKLQVAISIASGTFGPEHYKLYE